MRLSPGAVGRAATPLPPPGTPFDVTPIEGRVLELAARGLTDVEIAEALGRHYRSIRSVYERVAIRTGQYGRTRQVALWVLCRQRADLEIPARWTAGPPPAKVTRVQKSQEDR